MARRSSRVDRRTPRGAVLGGVMALLAPLAGAHAFELVSVKTARDGPAYLLRIEAVFDAVSPERMLAVLSDYEHIHELHPQILESRSLGKVAPATEEVFSRFRGCVLFLCQTLNRVERIRRQGNALVAEDVPGRGSFSDGHTEWQFTREGDGARLHYEARFVPAFSVAPVFGPAALARSLERMTLETMAETHRRALQRR
ncbi:MAG: SRPBCC family protein [Gammaproteobacteria bacterium]